jgi:hypothetical protein
MGTQLVGTQRMSAPCSAASRQIPETSHRSRWPPPFGQTQSSIRGRRDRRVRRTGPPRSIDAPFDSADEAVRPDNCGAIVERVPARSQMPATITAPCRRAASSQASDGTGSASLKASCVLLMLPMPHRFRNCAGNAGSVPLHARSLSPIAAVDFYLPPVAFTRDARQPVRGRSPPIAWLACRHRAKCLLSPTDQ